MTRTAVFAEIATAAGDPARAGMLNALMDGRALTASELASVAGITPQTASGHLARLTVAGLVAVQKQGRHRYHRLATQAVALTDAMVARGQIELTADAGIVTDHGVALLQRLGIDLDAHRKRKRRLLCRPCLDWSERRPHLAGAVGAALCTHCFDAGWIKRVDGSRAVTITGKGARNFREIFGIGAA